MKIRRVRQSDGTEKLEVIRESRKTEEKEKISEQAKETKKEETKTEEKSFKKIEPKHKWEDETVRKIYEEYLSGKGSISCGDLSRKYGVPRSTVWKIAYNIIVTGKQIGRAHV